MEHEAKLNSAKKQIPNSSTQIFCQKVLKHFPGSAKKEEADVQSSSGVSFSEMMSEASKISQKISNDKKQAHCSIKLVNDVRNLELLS